jgi:hypothetical protein
LGGGELLKGVSLKAPTCGALRLLSSQNNMAVRHHTSVITRKIIFNHWLSSTAQTEHDFVLPVLKIR